MKDANQIGSFIYEPEAAHGVYPPRKELSRDEALKKAHAVLEKKTTGKKSKTKKKTK